jgi:hypothetical protein
MALKMKYDIESLLFDIESVLSSKLNAKLSQISADKSDGITLRPVDNRAYFLQELNSRSANFNPFILYGVTSIESRPHLAGSAAILTVSVTLVLADHGNDTSIVKRMLRYSRALKETIQENFLLQKNSVNMEVHSLIPVEFQKLNSSENYRAVGIDIVVTLA